MYIYAYIHIYTSTLDDFRTCLKRDQIQFFWNGEDKTPDKRMKIEGSFTLLQLHVCFRAVLIRIPTRKQKQCLLSGMFCRIMISSIPNHFLVNRNRNWVVPVTLKCVTIYQICNQNVTKSVSLKKINKIQSG